MADPKLYTANPAQFSKLLQQAESRRTEKTAAEERWLELAMMLEG